MARPGSHRNRCGCALVRVGEAALVLLGPSTEKPGDKVTNERLRALGWFSSLACRACPGRDRGLAAALPRVIQPAKLAELASFLLERKPRLSL